MKIRDYFKKNSVMLLDGSTGVELMKRGLESGECPELWNVKEKDKVRDIAKMYFEAGSDAVLTNTLGGSSIKLGSYGLEDRTYELNKIGAENAVNVKPEGKFVIGSIGPTGGLLKPYGDLTEKEVVEGYIEQVKGLRDGGVDAVMLETFSDLNEIDGGIKAVRENSDLDYICSMTFDKGPRGYYTMMGVNVFQAAEFLVKENAWIVGSNCGRGIGDMVEILKLFREFSDEILLVGKPNAGIPRYEDGETVFDESPEFFREQLPRLLESRPSMIGGCCGSNKEHIKVMRDYLDRLV